MTTRAEIVAEARRYVAMSTPFRHQGRLPGVGLDCAGVLISIGRTFGIVPADFDITGYTLTPDGTLLGRLAEHMVRVPRGLMRCGDAICVAINEDPQHLGILADYKHGGFSMIHAASRRDGSGGVIETRLMFARGNKFIAAYSFPGVD
jgi:hypothetical protein